TGEKGDQGEIEFAEPLEGQPTARGPWDKIGLLVAVAIVLVVIAYAYPLIQHFGMERFGSPGFRPF
ncbi:MAG: hypothetical protein OEZ54_10925, partial [Gemmatimonadota bacterium]|nr:hypothetical protein [Gemmatimonadota bacterium]